MRILLRNGLVYYRGKFSRLDIIIHDGIIEDIGAHLLWNVTGEEDDNAIVKDCSKMYVIPSFVDLHVHLRDPGLTHKETILTGSKAAAAGGFGFICSMANTKPVNDNVETTKYIISESKKYGLVDVLPFAAVTKELNSDELVDFEELKKAGAVGFSNDGFNINNDNVMSEALAKTKAIHSMISTHPQDPTLTGKGHFHKCETLDNLGLPTFCAKAETVVIARDIELAKKTGGHVHVGHVSCKNSIELIRQAKKDKINVTTEVTPHHFMLTVDDIARAYETNKDSVPNYKMMPPLREKMDIEAIYEGLNDGTIDAIATDHAPHAYNEKHTDELTKSMNGIIGLQTMLPLSLELIRKKIITMEKFVELSSLNPAKLIHLKNHYIEKGNPADITVIDPNEVYEYNEELNQSMSTNSPFLHKKFTGIAKYTIKSGKVVWRYKDGKGEINL